MQNDGLIKEWIDFADMDFKTAKYLEKCDNLTPYGVKIRYPQELFIEEHHVKKALEETQELLDWMKPLFEKYKKGEKRWKLY